jgi:hypothetical protein
MKEEYLKQYLNMIKEGRVSDSIREFRTVEKRARGAEMFLTKLSGTFAGAGFINKQISGISDALLSKEDKEGLQLKSVKIAALSEELADLLDAFMEEFDDLLGVD